MNATDSESKPAPRKTIFSGIQPSGELSIGNYLGAVRTWTEQVREKSENDTLYFCIVDAHGITAPYKPKDMRARIDAFAINLLACGVDPSRAVVFVQSDVREHTELAWYLASVTPMGDLARMTQFKDKSDGQEFVSTALFTYPILMSADILLYKANLVPVGDDQLQHLELARETARRFNHRFGRIFPEPQPKLSASPRIMGTDGLTKMSKSKGNAIGLFDTPKDFWKKLQGAYTDPQRAQRSDPGRPDVCNIFTMHRAMSSETEQQAIRVNCETAAFGCYDCKKILHENFEREVEPMRERRESLQIETVRQILGDGAETARVTARRTLTQVREAMGLGSGVIASPTAHAPSAAQAAQVACPPQTPQPPKRS
jgi:tryptophanyl-tRNA synthetase